MDNHKAHPFVEALNAVAPLVVPSFKVVSLRDNKNNDHYPVLDYAIVSAINETYDPVKQVFTGRLQLFVELLLKEPRNANAFWCDVTELEKNQDRQALMYDLENKMRQIMVLITDPTKAVNDMRLSKDDFTWKDYDFSSLQVTTMQQVAQLPPKNLTGVSCQFNISYRTPRITCCITNQNSVNELEQLQNSFIDGSTSSVLIQNKIDKLNTKIPTLNLHWRHNAMSGANGATAVDGDVIDFIDDDSGNGFTLTSTLTGGDTIYRENGINGLPSFEFNGSFLQNLAMNIPSDPEVSIYIVLQRLSEGTGSYGVPFMLAPAYNSTGSSFLQLNVDLSTNYAFNFVNNALDEQLIPTDNEPLIISLIKTATNVSYYVNGVLISTKTGVQSIQNAAMFLGGWNGQFFNGWVGESFGYTAANDSVVNGEIINYLKTTWEINS